MARHGGIPGLTTHRTPPTHEPAGRDDSSDKAENNNDIVRDSEHHPNVANGPQDDAPTQDASAVIYNAPDNLSPARELAFVATICLAQFMTQIGLGSTLPILHLLGTSLGVSKPGELNSSQLPWITAGYSLTVGSFILVSGRLGDFFGYKRMLTIGLAWFAVWTMVAGLSLYAENKFLLFVFARALQGIGPSLCLPNGLALLGATYPAGKRKDFVFSFFAAAAPCGSITGAAFASLFALAWWPWAFFSFAIALAMTAIVGVFVIPDIPSETNEKQRKMSVRETFIQLDLLGGATGVTALVLCNFAWNQAPIVGWQEPYVYATFLIGILTIGLFFYIELRVSPLPLLPLKVLNSDVAFVLICLACGWASFGIWFYYTFQTFLLLRNNHNTGSTPLLATAMMAPEGLSGAIAAVVTGFLLSRLRPAWVMTLALLAFTLGTVLISTAPLDQTYWGQTFFATVVIAWGMDMSFPAATVILSNTVGKEYQGIGASLVNTIVNVSIAVESVV
ncbi:multidrug-resistance type transporter aminotriazole resistance [Friedmanniomyces endolithicus]|nr:multidrug-resistance type transporter aminotriazole resistance [Friedmanniomyces endolithicus]KAK1813663.1 multidrug-resistance type transporter aminotriazole resistance [Friedmanniomyces endolithicus]